MGINSPSRTGISTAFRYGIRPVGGLLVLALLVAGALPARAPDRISWEIVETGELPSDLRVYADETNGIASILADVMVDEEFIAQNGTDWRDALDLALDAANGILEEVGVRLVTASVTTWESNDDQTHMARILDEVLVGAHRGSGRMILVVTCQDSVRFDGISRSSVSAAATRHVHENWERNGSLIAHEVGHLLGANHHPANEECESDGCLMEKAGYAHATEWCDDHEEIIRAYLAEAATSPTVQMGTS